MDKTKIGFPKSRLLGGLVIGTILSAWIIYSYVIVPDTPTPTVIQLLFTIFVILVTTVWYSRYVAKKAHDEQDGFTTAVVTMLLAFGITFSTIVIVDNLFFEVVSRQSDRIALFNDSGMSSMREFTNIRLVKELLIGLPLFAFFGLVCGWILIARKLLTKIVILAGAGTVIVVLLNIFVVPHVYTEYTNTKYSYTLKYPVGWVAIEPSDGEGCRGGGEPATANSNAFVIVKLWDSFTHNFACAGEVDYSGSYPMVSVSDLTITIVGGRSSRDIEVLEKIAKSMQMLSK